MKKTPGNRHWTDDFYRGFFYSREGIDMYTSFAVGGPRDGVKITAGPEWDGRVRHPPGTRCVSTNPMTLYYPGKYVWHEKYGWTWVDEEPPPNARRRPHYAGYHTAY